MATTRIFWKNFTIRKMPACQQNQPFQAAEDGVNICAIGFFREM
jgi:hypothetical protein